MRKRDKPGNEPFKDCAIAEKKSGYTGLKSLYSHLLVVLSRNLTALPWDQ